MINQTVWQEDVHRRLTINYSDYQSSSGKIHFPAWEETLRTILNSDKKKTPPKDLNRTPLVLKVKELKDNNRKLKVKITVLENRILKLEAYINELTV